MAYSKIIYGGNVLIDLTGDTVAADKLLAGITAHGKDGEEITGTCAYDAATGDATAAEGEILLGKTAYVKGAKKTGTMPNRGSVTGTIATKAGEYTVPAGYHNGSGKVGISSTERAKIIAGKDHRGQHQSGRDHPRRGGQLLRRVDQGAGQKRHAKDDRADRVAGQRL